MINIDFTLFIMPSGDERWRLYSDTEGDLVISNDNGPIFSHEGILLVEFAIDIGIWLKSNSDQVKTNFVYNSQDFEEEPVIAFRQSGGGDLIVESSLVTLPEGLSVKSDELIQASKKFLKKLHEELVGKGIRLEKYDSFYLPT